LSTLDDLFNRQTRSYIGITVHFVSHEMLHNAMLRLQTIQKILPSWKHRNPQFEEIVRNFEIANTQLFSVAGRKLKLKRCRLTDKRFEALMFIKSNILKIDYLCLVINICGVSDGGQVSLPCKMVGETHSGTTDGWWGASFPSLARVKCEKRGSTLHSAKFPPRLKRLLRNWFVVCTNISVNN